MYNFKVVHLVHWYCWRRRCAGFGSCRRRRWP